MAGFNNYDPFSSGKIWSKFSHDELDLLLEGENKPNSQQISKFQKTKEELLTALNENNFDDIKQILQSGTFKGSDGKEIKKMLPVLLNTNYSKLIHDKLTAWEESRIVKPEDDDEIDEWKQMQERLTIIIQDLLIKKSKSTKIYESHTDFFLDSIPDIAHEVAWDLIPDDKQEPTNKQELFDYRKEKGRQFLKEYPLASKSLYHTINSKKYNKELREKFIWALGEWISIKVQSEIKQELEGKRVTEDMFFDYIFQRLYLALVPVLKDLPDIYENYTIALMQQEFASSHNAKLEQQNQQEKHPSKKNEQKKEIWLMLDILGKNIDPAQMEQIKSQVETLNLSPKEKKDLMKKIARLLKNQKPFKKVDYFWEKGLIKTEDEGKILDLIEDLGIQIVEENQTSLSNSEVLDQDTNSEQKEAKTDSIQKFTSWEELNLSPVSLEMPIEELVSRVFENFKSFWYEIPNPKKLSKELEEFFTVGSNKESVLSALSNPTIMKNPIRKNGNIYSLNLTTKDRLLLLKGKDTWEIDSFHDDHDAYEDRIDAIK